MVARQTGVERETPMTKKATPKTKTATRRHMAAFTLSALERMLLVLYHSVPVPVRAEVGRHLFHAWTHPAVESERKPGDVRYRAAMMRFKLGTFGLGLFDDIQAGETVTKKRGQ